MMGHQPESPPQDSRVGPSCSEKNTFFHLSDWDSYKSGTDSAVQGNGPGVWVTRNCCPAPKTGLGAAPSRADTPEQMRL